jgi:UDP-2,3-diacylglucosamine hydrolase
MSMMVWPTESLPRKITFVSDLHLFSTRSTAERHREMIVRASREADLVVLGGDLFDFRWSRIGDHRATSEEAIRWLERLIEEVGHDRVAGRHFAFLYGNHDGDTYLRSRLVEWSARRDDFSLAGDLLRIGDIAMLHGDAIEGGGIESKFSGYRERWAAKPQASLNHSRAYDAALSTGAHRLVAAIAHRRRRTFTALIRYLEQQQTGPTAGVRRIVFGHTHRYLRGIAFGGVHFYNPGATVRAIPFQPVVLSSQTAVPSPSRDLAV